MRRLIAVLAIAMTARLMAQAPDPFAAFFDAADAATATAEADKLLAGKVDFDTAYARLKQGRRYGDEKRGEYALRWRSRSGPFFNNIVNIPADYDPASPIQLRVQLHGGVARPSPNAVAPGREAPGRGANRIEGERQIYLHPSGWADAQWWDEEQVDNIFHAVDALKRKYNIDESRIYITGISDGATGVYYMALKAPTIWASYLPLNGSIGVLANFQTGADGEMYGNNFVNDPLYIVNGEQDPLYPVAGVEPHIRWFRAMGVPFVFRPQAGAGHNTNWWPTERAPYETFVHDHPRVPHPETLSWETERVDKFNRNRWLVIDKLRRGEGPPADPRLEDTGLFRHVLPSGRVDVTRTGNGFAAKTRGVAQFTLLLSPDAVDFSKPVTMTVNGKPVAIEPVRKDVAALLRWAARDNDRTMLYGAELKVAVP
jgi:predicted esterase